MNNQATRILITVAKFLIQALVWGTFLAGAGMLIYALCLSKPEDILSYGFVAWMLMLPSAAVLFTVWGVRISD